ncbi:7228_t:CDS:2, partial [Paraglomus occultum]
YVVAVSAQTFSQTPNFGTLVNIAVAPTNKLCTKGIVVDAVTSIELGRFLDSHYDSFTPWEQSCQDCVYTCNKNDSSIQPPNIAIWCLLVSNVSEDDAVSFSVDMIVDPDMVTLTSTSLLATSTVVLVTYDPNATPTATDSGPSWFSGNERLKWDGKVIIGLGLGWFCSFLIGYYSIMW